LPWEIGPFCPGGTYVAGELGADVLPDLPEFCDVVFPRPDEFFTVVEVPLVVPAVVLPLGALVEPSVDVFPAGASEIAVPLNPRILFIGTT
jgi:hypothetical protein